MLSPRPKNHDLPRNLNLNLLSEVTEQIRPDFDKEELEGKNVHVEERQHSDLTVRSEMYLVVDDDIEGGGGSGGIEMSLTPRSGSSLSISYDLRNKADDTWQIDAPSSSSSVGSGEEIELTGFQEVDGVIKV